MREHELELLRGVPLDDEAEQRAWSVVASAFAEREPLPRPRGRLVLAAVAAAAVAAAAVASPPGRAVVDAVRRSVGIANARPALFRLPAPGRVLVSGPGGTWVVRADGSKRRLGDYREAAWSPHGRFVVAVGDDQLVTLDPGGDVHWTLARPGIRFPRWGGSRTDTRIAYLSGRSLRVVAGDGTGDRPLALRVARVAPAWSRGGRRMLAYIDSHGRAVTYDVDRARALWRSRPLDHPRQLLWLPDGRQLLVSTAHGLVVVGRRGSHLALRVRGAVAVSPRGRLATIDRGSILLPGGTNEPTLTVRAALVGLAWSPDARWLLTTLPAADQWLFVQVAGGRRVLAVSHIVRQFGGRVVLDGWAPGP